MIKLVELFSGIGSQAKAIASVCKKEKMSYKVLNTCEWDIHAIVAYDFIHNGANLDPLVKKMSREDVLAHLSKYSLSNDGKKPLNMKTLRNFSDNYLKQILSSIYRTHNFVDIKELKGNQLPNDVTILTYSFPCQDLSSVGSFHGYNKGIDRDANTRSGLLWQVERLLLERQKENLDLPQFLLLENVTNLEAKRHNKNFLEWQNSLTNMGYINCIYKLYSPNFGIPQNRKRLLMLSIYVGNNENKKSKIKKYLESHNLNNLDYIKSLNIKKRDLKEFLKLDYTNPIYLDEAIKAQPNSTKSRLTIWNNNSKLVDERFNFATISQTITTKQDRHPNSGNIYFDYKNNKKSKFRFLTPRECFLLMGFKEKDYESLINNNFASKNNSLFFSRDRLYKLAGNSIIVDMLKPIFKQVIDIIRLCDDKDMF